MAEFKLGRIRFIWKGNWSPETTYYKDDIVRNGGNTYVCVQGHDSSLLFVDDQSIYWNKISDGVEWKGDWIPQVYYNVNDIVKYGGYIYICNTAHESAIDLNNGLEEDQEKWDLFAEGFDYKAAWSPATRYKINDIVKYGATVYICVEEHISALTEADGLEADLSDDSTVSKWEIFSEGLFWTDVWQSSFRYKRNDVVRYGGQLYLCNMGHSSAETDALGLEADQEKWDYLHKGIEYKGDWSKDTRYKINDIVKYGGGLWICVTFHTSQTYFTDDESKWAQFVEGLEFEDSWDPDTRYQPGDFVTYGGYSYVAATNNKAVKPTESPEDWDLFTAGFRFVGEWGVDPEDNQDSSAYEYKVGDVVTKNGYTYLCIQDHTAQEPPNDIYWERLNSGIKWRNDVGLLDGSWTAGTEYKLGDAVSYTKGDTTNFYICVNEHSNSITPLDDDGTNWNIVSGGPEQGNLSESGDLVYYKDGVGPTVLRIGSPGQVLVVNNDGNAPVWRNFGSINHVYFVEGQNGADEPAPSYGITLDRPWKTIKYATEQVEQGALRPNTKQLIELNRAFIINETLEWINDQISSGTGIWSGFTNDDEYLTVEEFNKVLNSLTFDITHSGNEKTRTLTLNYFVDDTSLKTDLQDEDEQFIASLNYLESVVIAVINNQELGVDIGTKYSAFSQTINTNITRESDAETFVSNLFNIITEAISEGQTGVIPREYKPNNSIFVKTGEFSEILPMSVPENTAVIGDELRSTRIIPAGSVIDQSDVPYSLDAITRLRDMVDPLIFGSDDITKTASNTEDPVDTGLVLGDSSSAAAAADLFQQINDYIDFEINGGTADSTTPVITGTNTANTATNFTYAVEVIEKNKTFLVEEAVAYIKEKYPSYVFDEDEYRQYLEKYVDAVKYDLIYTGNYRSILAAKGYTHAVKGSKLSDMFYMRNGTGLRNCSVKGLDGRSDGNVVNTSIKGLSDPNEYGTRRPLAGAFVSLDPGWGPLDERVWITNKSPYVQNVSTFGEGCIGCKIDGDLHDGGNDSIVANDFTQLCSAGIGVWCTNLGRTELVSVFSYYAHIGYLAENGGKIRATNGNSSYGDFGTVAEDVDSTEVPINGVVDNQSVDAIVRRVATDGDQVLTAEFSNAGVKYTTSTTAITAIESPTPVDDSRPVGTYYGVVGVSSGTGTGQKFNVTIDDLGIPTADIVKGGTGHVAGDIITIPDSELGNAGAPDVQIEVAEIGDATRWVITGEGFGAQVDNANTVNGGIYQVRLRNIDVTGDSEGDFGGDGYTFVENVAQGGDSTSITLSNTDTAVAGSQYEGTQSGDGIAIYLTAGKGAGQYGYVSSYNPATKVADIRKFSDGTVGWDHLVDGTAIESSLDESTNYSIEPYLAFTDPSGNSPGDVGYNYATAAKARAIVQDEKITEVLLWDPGTGYTTDTGSAVYPTLTINDPNNTVEAPFTIRVGETGVLTQPTWSSRGTQFATASAEITGDGYADVYQPGANIQVKGLTDIPEAGSNITFDSLSGKYYKLVAVRNLDGLGPYTANLQISPELDIEEAPEHEDPIELRIRYSQVRLTGHDYLDIGTGNFAETNYPNEPEYEPDPDFEVVEGGGGRVFYTSTDQDGNFRVGRLFNVEQSTGVATLNAEAFNISGLQELQLGSVELGGTGAVITEFSTDGTFTANSDNIVPTQKAIKTYIQSQIGGGAGELNVNSITAGSVFITGQQITNTTGDQINILQKVNYTGGIGGSPVALNYFLQS